MFVMVLYLLQLLLLLSLSLLLLILFVYKNNKQQKSKSKTTTSSKGSTSTGIINLCLFVLVSFIITITLQYSCIHNSGSNRVWNKYSFLYNNNNNNNNYDTIMKKYSNSSCYHFDKNSSYNTIIDFLQSKIREKSIVFNNNNILLHWQRERTTFVTTTATTATAKQFYTSSSLSSVLFVNGYVIHHNTINNVCNKKNSRNKLLHQQQSVVKIPFLVSKSSIKIPFLQQQIQQYHTTSLLSLSTSDKNNDDKVSSSSTNNNIINDIIIEKESSPMIVDSINVVDGLIYNNTSTSTNSSIDTSVIPNESSTNTATTTQSHNNNKKNKKKQYDPIPLTTTIPNINIQEEFPDWMYNTKDFFRYELVYESKKSLARVGRIHTPHGIIDTPGYVAVATNGALKGIDFRDANNAGQQLIFCNTYHLMIHPGPNIIQQAGGIHSYTNRHNYPFITDSGGFQVFSLAYGTIHEEIQSQGELKRSYTKGKNDNNNKNNNNHNMGDAVQITEDGVIFKSYRDGTKFLLTPETTIQSQKQIGADIIIPLDELPGYYTSDTKLINSVARTHRWETRSLIEHYKNIQSQAIYCVIHGGINKTIRTESINYLTSLPFDGYAIGGSLGNGKDELKHLLQWMMPLINNLSDDTNDNDNDDNSQDNINSNISTSDQAGIVSNTSSTTIGNRTKRKYKPRHLLGIADEENIRTAVQCGIDTMDSCYPTRIGRHGTVLTRNGPIKLVQGKHKTSFNIKIDDQCTCTTCQQYDRAYLWHLFKANEPIAVTLASIHNIHYMNDLMKQIRNDILNDII